MLETIAADADGHQEAETISILCFLPVHKHEAGWQDPCRHHLPFPRHCVGMS